VSKPLESARQVFLDRGLAEATMADVAEAARVAKGTIYPVLRLQVGAADRAAGPYTSQWLAQSGRLDTRPLAAAATPASCARSWARCNGADLTDAEVYGADLSETLGLTQAQVDAAYGDADTRLPNGLRRPYGWTAGGRPTMASF